MYAARLAAALDLYEYQGKQLFKRFGIPVSEGKPAKTPEEARAAAEELGGPGRRQGAGADRRSRQGGRDQARRRPGRRGGEGEADPRPRHPRPRRPHALDRERLRHREGVLPLDHVRPRRQEAALHVHDAGRDGHRGGRREDAGCARPPARRSARGLPALAGSAADLRRRGRGSERAEADRRDRREALRGVRRDRRDALRDQPADRDAGRRGEGARLQVHRRRQRALQAPGDRRDARRRGGRPAGGARAREGRHLRQARRRGRDPRQRRGARDVDAGRDRARRRHARELLRPRRRRRRGGRGRRARGDHARPAGEVDLLQHLRRDHALRRGRARASSRRSSG